MKLFSARKPLLGRIDQNVSGVIHGWAHDPNDMHRRFLIDIFYDDEFVGQTLANLKREDLSSAGIGDGFYGFTIDTGRSESNAQVTAYILDTNRRGLISSSGQSIQISLERNRLTPKDYLIKTFHRTVRRLADVEFDSMEMPGDYQLQEHLLESNNIDLSKIKYPNYYQRLICHRWQQSDFTTPFLSREQYDNFLNWYLSVYGFAQRPRRVPLSKQDLLHLNSEANHPFSSRAETIFTKTFVSQSDPNPQANAFFWGTYLAASLGVEDFSITESHKNQLLNHSTEYLDFQMTPFIRRFVSGNPLLKGLTSSTVEQRAFLYFAISLYAIHAPHLLQLLPKDNFFRLFQTQQKTENSSIFQNYCHSLFQVRIEDPLLSLRQYFRTRQFDLDSLTFSTRTINGSRLHVTPLRRSQNEIADIQIIGPLTRGLGIGESCRKLVTALQNCSFNTRICDFSLGHPNKKIDINSIEIAPIGRAKINIIHLNLDELPDLLVYSPDIFSMSYNILFPYVEVAPLVEEQTYALKIINEIWAATAFIHETLQPYCKCIIMGAGISDRNKTNIDYENDRRSRQFTFFVTADALSGIYRKNILGAVEAFLIAFPHNSDVRLVIKTHSLEKVSNPLEQAAWKALFQAANEDSRIEIIDRYLSPEEHSNILRNANALISLHRAEGLGYHVLEAMLDEIPVITTSCSGTVDFCQDETAFIVPHKTVFVQNNQYVRVSGGQTWSEPDIAIAAQTLKFVYENPILAKQKATRAKEFVKTNFSMEKFSSCLRSRVTTILDSLPLQG